MKRTRKIENEIPMCADQIKVIKRMAYGLRDDEYFFLKIRSAFPGTPG